MAWHKYFDLRNEFEIQRKHCLSTCMRIKPRQVHAELLFYKRQFIAKLARQNHNFRSILNYHIEMKLSIHVGDKATPRVRRV